MAGYIGTQAVSVNTTSATISDDLTVGDDATITGDLAVDGVANLDNTDIDGTLDVSGQVTVADGSAGAPSISNTGDVNTGIFFPAADTIGFAEGGAEAARFDSSGNFLCGTTATGTGALGFRYRKDLNAISAVADGQIAAYFGTRSSDGEILRFRKDDGDVGSIATWSGNIAVGRLNCALLFDDDTNRIKPASVQSNSARDNVIDLGDPDHRFNDVWIGGGIHLGGTGAANKLNDYETGTFQPSVTFNGASSGVQYTSNRRYGIYTKIGNVVTYFVHVELTNKGSSTGGANITGMPFTATNANGNQNYVPGSSFIAAMASLSSNLMIRSLSGTTNLDIYQINSSSTYSTVTNANFTNTTGIQVSGVYFV